MKKLFTTSFLLISLVASSQSFEEKFSTAAIKLTNQEVTYDPSYFSIPYPEPATFNWTVS